MGWPYLGILFVLSLLACLCGFKKYVYFMSIGYGFSVAVIGIALTVMSVMGIFSAQLEHYLLFIVLIAYGVRLSGFLLYREMKNEAYRKTLKEATGEESAMPFFVKVAMWLCMGVYYVAQTSPVTFRMVNGGETSALVWVGIVICVCAIVLEAEADREKSAQKAARPDMVATQGLYKIVRCPNYLGEILFWTGLTLSALDTLTGIGQWATVLVAWILIILILFNGAQRLEKRQMARYGVTTEYNAYVNKTPILIPLVPLYHLNKQK